MASDIEQLRAIKSQALARLAELTANPKPNYAIDGQSVSWGDYLDRLRQTVAWVDERLSGEEPFEFDSVAFT